MIRWHSSQRIFRTHNSGVTTGRERVHLLYCIIVTADTSQSPITPYGSLVPGTFEAAKVGHDPSGVSPKHPPVQPNCSVQVPTAAFKAFVSAGANTACVPMSMVQKSESFKEIVMVYIKHVLFIYSVVVPIVTIQSNTAIFVTSMISSRVRSNSNKNNGYIRIKYAVYMWKMWCTCNFSKLQNLFFLNTRCVCVLGTLRTKPLVVGEYNCTSFALWVLVCCCWGHVGGSGVVCHSL